MILNLSMGNDILSSDMLVGGLVRSMYNGFQFKDYTEGCWAMFDLNEFLKGFGGAQEQDNGDGTKIVTYVMAIDDMPQPDANVGLENPRTRHDPDSYYLNYRRMYAGALMKAVGIYQRTMIDAIKERGYQ